MRSSAISPLLLAGAVAGMALIFLAPPLLALFGTRLPRRSGLGRRGRLMALVVPADAALLPAVAVMGPGAAADRAALHALHARFRLSTLARPRRPAGRGASRSTRRACHEPAPRNCVPARAIADENFPVASLADRARGIARPSWRSTNSCASPTISPITPTLAGRREARAARRAGGEPARPRRRRAGGRCAARGRWPSAGCRRSMRRTC